MALFCRGVYFKYLQRKAQVSLKDHLSIKNCLSREARLHWENYRSRSANHSHSRNLKRSLKAYLYWEDCWSSNFCWERSKKAMSKMFRITMKIFISVIFAKLFKRGCENSTILHMNFVNRFILFVKLCCVQELNGEEMRNNSNVFILFIVLSQ